MESIRAYELRSGAIDDGLVDTFSPKFHERRRCHYCQEEKEKGKVRKWLCAPFKAGSLSKESQSWRKKDLDGKKVGSSLGRYSNYTPLNTSLDQVLMQIEDDPSLKWPKRMKGNPSK